MTDSFLSKSEDLFVIFASCMNCRFLHVNSPVIVVHQTIRLIIQYKFWHFIITVRWPSGLRRQFKALVFGRGFESRPHQDLLLLFFF